MVFGLSKKLDKKTTVFQSFDDTSCWSGGSKTKGETDVNDEAEGPPAPLRKSVSRGTSKMAIFSRKSPSVSRNPSSGTHEESESSSDDDDLNLVGDTAVATAEPINRERLSILKAPSMEFDKEFGDILDEVENDPEILAAMMNDMCSSDESETSFTETDEGGALIQLDFAASGASGADGLQITMSGGSSDVIQLNLVGGNDSALVNARTEEQVLTVTEVLTENSEEEEDLSEGSEIECLPDDSFSDLVRAGNSAFYPLELPDKLTRKINPQAHQQGVLALLSSSKDEDSKSHRRRKSPSKPLSESSSHESPKKDKVRRSTSTVDGLKPSSQRRPSNDRSSSAEKKHVSRSQSAAVGSELSRSDGVSKKSDELRDRRGSTHRSSRPSPDKRRQSRTVSTDRSSGAEEKSSKPKEDSATDSRSSRRSSQHQDSKGSRRPSSKSKERPHNNRPSIRRPSGDAEKEVKLDSDKSRNREPNTKTTESHPTEVLALDEGLAMMAASADPTESPSQKSRTSTMVVDGYGSPCRSSPRRNPSRRPRKLSSMAPLAENIEASDKMAPNAMDWSAHSAPSATDAQASQRLSQSLHSSPRRRISRISRFNKPIPENGEGEAEPKASSLFESKLLQANDPIQGGDESDQAIPAASSRERKVTASTLRESIMTPDKEEEQPEIGKKDKKSRKSKRLVGGPKKKESKKNGDGTES